MLTIYHSNQLDLLKSLTVQLISRQPLDSVFTKEVILVQSQGMSQWLQIQLAQDLGISANIHYPFPAQFVWDIYRVCNPDLPFKNTFNIDYMVWILLKILPELSKTENFNEIAYYFKDNDERKVYQLATYIADLFDQYLVYRSDWLKAWEEDKSVAALGNEQQWQARLWRKLVSYSQNSTDISQHRANIHNNIMSLLAEKRLTLEQKNQLPKRIFIFGIVSLPPIYLTLFHALSEYIDIHFMYMNPCKHYWGDIADNTYIDKYIKNEQMASMMRQGSHPLLSSFGKLGRDHLALLQNYHKNEIEAFADYERHGLLNEVQQSILEMKNNDLTANDIKQFSSSQHKQQLSPNDNSITLHACHGEQREVEVLYDYLLSILDSDKSIGLNDCVVMVTDIDHYMPYIKAVFDNAPKTRYLPYTISDQTLRYVEPTVQGFFLLLELPQSRLDIEYIFSLLEIPAIAKKFQLNDESLQQLQHWIIDAGIRFGLESDIDQPHSWFMGLKRMLLGYIMESELDSWQGIFPYEGTTGLNAELIGFLSEFITAIAKWRSILIQQHTILQWKQLCAQLLDTFFVVESETESLLLMIQNHWDEMIEQAILAHYTDEIGITILNDFIHSKFEQQRLSHRFLIGKINFCTMMPMRSVPFKVVCLLGMNDGSYPRVSPTTGFDLIAKHYRIGDRNRRNDDRYLFLEALLSAEKKLYISYVGYNIQTNDPRYPSILVEELLEYISQNYVLPDDINKASHDSAERLKNYLTEIHARTPFNFKNYLKDGSKMVSYADEWLPAAKSAGQYSPFICDIENKKSDTMSIHDLKYFYIHSVRALSKNRLGYTIHYLDEQLPITEHFNLDSFERYKINTQILDASLSSEQESADLQKKLYQKLLRSNQLPYGHFGQLLYTEQKELMDPLTDKIHQNKQGELSSLEVNLMIDSTHLQGWIVNLQQDGILQWRSAKLTIKDGISLWIDHLIFCLLKDEHALYNNRMYGRDETQWAFGMLSKEQALTYLSQLISGYQSGINQPLFMPLQSTWRWLETAYDQATKLITDDNSILMTAKKNFIISWQGNIGIPSECDDYYLRLYPELTDELIDTAIQAAKCYLLPIILHRET